jgi:molybdopterin-guanine dinucleotide biosynthesis protein A
MAAAAVLAGGASRRMGRDKATLAVGGVALAARVLAAAAQVADPVVLVAPDGHPARRLGALVVTDPGEGPLAALAAALAALADDHVLALAGDHPGLAVYRRAPALAAARSRLAGPAGGRTLLGLLASLDTVVVEEPAWRVLDPGGRSFVDLDDPGDLAAWERGPR